MSIDWSKDIADMHDKLGIRTNLTGEFLRFRQNFLIEELDEFDEAITENNPEKVVDALIDLCVVAIGTLDLAGVDSKKAWDTVQYANMKKQRGENSTRPGSMGFDLVKPPNWVPPSHLGNTGSFDSACQDIQDKNIPPISRTHKIPSHVKTLYQYISYAMAKCHDYDDDTDSEFFHAAYYPEGIDNILYEIAKKVKRLRHIIGKMKKKKFQPKTDGLHDSFRDVSIYAAIGGTYVEGNLEGQTKDKDIFNRSK
jgi:hypothetical protein